MKRRAWIAAALLLASSMRGADDPHGKSWGTQCLSCHSVHKSAGQSLTRGIANESVCISCHNLGGTAARFPIEVLQKADPSNRLGSSHAWNVNATNGGALVPQNAEMARRLDGGNVTCSVCHEIHDATMSGSQNISAPARIAGSGTGNVTATGTSAAAPKGYLLEIVEQGGAAGSARFRFSNDGGLSWFATRATGTNVQLSDGANVTVTFAGDFVVGDRFRFYVGYPFLRSPLDAGDNSTGSKFCRDCHRDMAMDHSGTNSWTGTMRSHPVGVALNANGAGYDRAVPLDANGLPQGGSGDANPTNDLRLASDQTVQCLTCHGVHHADGNSATVDQP